MTDQDPLDAQWAAYNNEQDGWLVYDASLPIAKRYSYPLIFKGTEPPLPVPSDGDALDQLYEAATKLLLHAFSIEDTDKDVDWGVSQEFASHALKAVEIWLQRREADRQHELAEWQSGIIDPKYWNVPTPEERRGGIGIDVQGEIFTCRQCGHTYQKGTENKSLACLVLHSEIGACCHYNDRQINREQNKQQSAQDSP